MYIKEHTDFGVPDFEFSRLRPFIPNYSRSFPNVPVYAQLSLYIFCRTTATMAVVRTFLLLGRRSSGNMHVSPQTWVKLTHSISVLSTCTMP